MINIRFLDIVSNLDWEAQLVRAWIFNLNLQEIWQSAASFTAKCSSLSCAVYAETTLSPGYLVLDKNAALRRYIELHAVSVLVVVAYLCS